MLNRNLIIIVIVSLAVVFSSNAFGQIHKRTLKLKEKQTSLPQKPKTTARHFGADMLEGTNIRQKNPNRRKFDHIGNFNKTKKTRKLHDYNLGDTATHRQGRRRAN